MVSDNKRSSDHLSPPTDLQKKFSWKPVSLLERNKYYLPEHLEPSTSNEAETVKEPAKTKIPPIFLHGPVNHKEVINDIKTLVQGEFFTTLSSASLKIILSNENDYRSLAKHYLTNKIEFHTYQNPNERPLSVVIKNVPPSLTEEDIKEELAVYNLPITSITRLLNKDRTPMPVCAILLTANEKANEIFNVNKIYHSVVTVEPRKVTRKTPQCHRCQRIGHTKNYCRLEPRCVRCQGKHLYTDCDKSRKEPPICTNCGENHPANFRGCKYFLESRSYQGKSTQNEMHKTTNINYKQVPENNTKNFPHLTNHIPPNGNWHTKTNTSSSETSPILNTILSSILNLIQPFLEQIKQFILSNLLPSLLNGP